MKKDQSEIKNAVYEINDTLEGINSRLDKAEDQISDLEDKVGKNTLAEEQKENRILCLFNFNFLLLLNYSCVPFFPIPPPHPS